MALAASHRIYTTSKLIYEHLLETARLTRAAIANQQGPNGVISIDPLKGSPRPVQEVKLRPRS
jgi:hypothetical protein